jgi:biopolymer transport protein TolR
MDAEVNLVPFIDLMSCCICFLLVSAVWTQVAKIDVKPAPNLPSDAPPPPETVKLTVHLRGNGYFLSDGKNNVELPKANDVYPIKDLAEKVKLLRQAYPDVTAVTVMSDETIKYKELIAVMDLCLKEGLADISVAGS